MASGRSQRYGADSKKWRWKPGALARNTVLATAWQGLRSVLQFAYLVLVARILGAEGYGIFSGIVGLAASLSPLVGLGFGMILVQDVSRAPDQFAANWAKALRAVAVSAPVMTVAMLLLAQAMLPIKGIWAIVLLVAVAELVAMPIVAIGSLAFQAHERIGRTIFNHVQLNLARLVAVAGLVVAVRPTLLEFAVVYFAATAFAAVLSLFQVWRAFGAPAWKEGTIAGKVREGMGFSLSVLANGAHGEVDKTLLLGLGGATSAGNYSLAARVVSAATMPLVAYILALVPRLFREGGKGVFAAKVLALRLLPPILLYGAAVAAALILFAPLLPWIFGRGFAATLPLVFWLAPVPLLVGASQLTLNVLSASGNQRIRVVIEAMALVFNIVLNLVLIPARGAEGAAIAMLASQSLLVVLPVISVRHLGRGKG